jgi:hypothetical protein
MCYSWVGGGAAISTNRVTRCPPDDVLQEIVDNFIEKYNFTAIQKSVPEDTMSVLGKGGWSNVTVSMPLMQ